MKIRLHPGRYALTFVMVALPLFYWNCSGFKTSPGFSADSSSSTAPTSSYVMGPGSSGPLPAYQDITFHFVPSGNGPFTATGVPSWATFDTTTGQIIGVPLTMASGGSFTVHSSGGTYGPYAVSIVGNPLKEYQWHLTNTGQTAFAMTAGTPGEDIHMHNTVARGITGSGVRVAVSDTGLDIGHEAISPNLLSGESRNYLLNTANWLGNPTPDLSTGDNAHGTAVTSLIAEKGWNGIGGRGVAPNAHYAAFLFIEAQDQLSSSGKLSQALDDQFTGNFDVFNYSWTDPQCALSEYPQSLFDRMKTSYLQQNSAKGSSMLMAGGNNYIDDVQSCYTGVASQTVFDNVNFSEINTTPYIMNIGATNASGASASYSTPGSALWVSAPGGEYGWDTTQTGVPAFAYEPAIIAADFPGCSSGLKAGDTAESHFDAGTLAQNSGCKYVSTMNGTSSATPITSGTVALLLEANPSLTARDIKYILAKTADMVDPAVNPATHPGTTSTTSYDLTGHAYEQGWVTNAAGFHFMNYFGFGRINVDNAVAMAQTYVSALGTYQETNWTNDSGTLSLAIPDHSATGVTATMNVASNLTIEAVQMRVTTDGCAGDIGLELTSPSGTKSIVMNINSRIIDGAIQNHTFLSNAFYGEHAAGTWTLKALDGFVGCTAHLTNWKLNIAGH